MKKENRTMGKREVLIYIAAILAVLIYLVPGVLAFGISPARATVNFSPGLERQISFSIINSEHRNINLSVSAGGELAGYITLNQSAIYISASEDSKGISYSLKLPSELSPGPHSAEIVIREIKGGTESQFSALMAVVNQLVVNVPYPQKYVEAAVSIEDARVGENTIIRIPLANKGSVTISKVEAEIKIYDSKDNYIMTIDSGSISLGGGERKEVIATWTPKVTPGNYKAVVRVSYDGQILNLEKEFSLGIVELKINEIRIGKFKLGGIAKIDINVMNQWDGEIKNAHSRIVLIGDDGNRIREFNSPDVNVMPLGSVVMTSYLESSGMKEGDYNATIYLEAEKISSKENFVFKVRENEIIIGEIKESSWINNLVTEIGIILIIFAVFVAYWFVRKKYGTHRRHRTF